TVFINDEYTADSVEGIIEKEKEKEKNKDADVSSISAARGSMSTDEKKADEEDVKEEQKILENIALKRGLQETVLSRRISSFSVDVYVKDSDEWKDINVENKVPAALKITVGMGEKDTQPEEIDSEKNEIQFTSIFRPVIARYVSNTYPEASAKTKRPVPDTKKRVIPDGIAPSMRSVR
ncbi:hypothetical protein ACFL6F_03665, partial [Planctomycetota bacterium]